MLSQQHDEAVRALVQSLAEPYLRDMAAPWRAGDCAVCADGLMAAAEESLMQPWHRLRSAMAKQYALDTGANAPVPDDALLAHFGIRSHEALLENDVFHEGILCVLEHVRDMGISLWGRLREDRPALYGALGIAPDDLPAQVHVAGENRVHWRTVCVAFQSGRRIIYTDNVHGYSMAAGWLRFLSLLAPDGMAAGVRALPREGYGWREYVEPAPLDSAEQAGRYYTHAGYLLGLLHLLGTRDMHCENIIACGVHPTPIDLELLLVPQIEALLSPIAAAWDKTVLATQLLPTPIRMYGGLPRDIGGLTGTGSGAQNLAYFRGKPILATLYADEIAQGFSQAIDAMRSLDAQSVLDCFSGACSRIILRSNKAYAQAFDMQYRLSLTMDACAAQAEMGCYLRQLQPLLPEEVLEAEETAIRKGIISRYWMPVDATDLMCDGRRVASGFAAISARERTYHRLQALAGDARRQQEIIRGVLSASAEGRLAAWYRSLLLQKAI